MRNFVPFFLVVGLFMFVACADTTPRPPKVTERIAYGDYIPPENNEKMAAFIKETVSAASLQMTGGDYEDPEDVIEQAEETATRLYTIRIKGLEELDRSTDWWTFTPEPELTPNQKRIFDKLNQ